jgi:hypothetical protein
VTLGGIDDDIVLVPPGEVLLANAVINITVPLSWHPSGVRLSAVAMLALVCLIRQRRDGHGICTYPLRRSLMATHAAPCRS